MDVELAGRIVVVTGASKGIGLACAKAFAREGAKVVGVSRDMGHLHAAQHELQHEGLHLDIAAADLQVDVPQYPERLEVGLPPAEHDLLQPVIASGIELVGLPQVPGLDDDVR